MTRRWWIGDWLAYGERTYGETYVQAGEATGRQPEDLMNMAYVSAHVGISYRNENLSWSHHREVAALEPVEQQRWLAKAEAEDWSKRDLHEQLGLATRPGAVAMEAVA